jgi:methionyl-tRNA formyltransferase
MALISIFNGSYVRHPQNENEATEYNVILTPKDSLLDWNKSLKELYNEIRACDSEEYPAYFIVDGQKVFIKLWRDLVNKESNFQI